ncbi:hypothetical protein HN51_053426 [Arachis hypogaea]|uniref:Uncharacterized protein n=1 Tax=Arachis hypogaea TaxID=3818 RepID=A0A444XC71_ARAHY|nr:uncharacterized protein LOC107614637 [Arachis ipaensis]XP_025677561.1 uncharacterized protein LOC112777408 [Arachis hypogaea]QHN75774.1 uncharacterized protein DS421_19g638180 [Arachis hypogaea]RYQ87321.1 hypothetical protein Ahy_B09g094803 [Arachis hypogaea]
MATSNNGKAAAKEREKEERRRRIAERGSDRMALITGKINTLPPQPPSGTSSPRQPHHYQTQSLGNFDKHLDNAEDLLRHLRPQSLSPAFASEYEEEYMGGSENEQDSSTALSRLKHQGGFRYSNFKDYDIQKQLEQQDSEEDNMSKNIDGYENNSGKIKLPLASKAAQMKAALEAKRSKRTGPPKPAPFFSSRELNACIIASETKRALSSLMIAMIVVFCYMISARVEAMRPLYILLITNVTIVLSRLYSEKAKLLEETNGVNEDPVDLQSWGDAVRLLERGLVAYQAIRGIFIDCSIYLVIVVCGVSMV